MLKASWRKSGENTGRDKKLRNMSCEERGEKMFISSRRHRDVVTVVYYVKVCC